MAKFESEIIIQETDLDLFGHVNNAAYLRLFENARWKFITEWGVGLKQIQEAQIGPVILEIKIRFIKELKAQAKIRIVSDFDKFNGKIGHIRQQMLNEKLEVCCEADFTMAIFDMRLRKIVSPTPEWVAMT